MANGSRRRSSSAGGRGGARRPADRSGGGRRAPARGGGNNAMPIVVGIVLVGALVAVIAFASGGKKKKAEPYVSTELTADSNASKNGNQGPKRPERPPPPQIPQEIIENAKTIVSEMEADKERGDALYDEAMRAKDAGNRDEWQSKLKQAAEFFVNIKDRWNDEIIYEIEAALPSGCQWDAEEVANHWLGKEGGKVSKALEKLAFIKKQLGTQ